MALRELGARLGSAFRSDARPCLSAVRPVGCRNASSSPAADPVADLENSSSFSAPPPEGEVIKNWNPVERHRRRERLLPSSRYKFRSPKYYRGPLHPHQPPPESDPASRLFIPGPFISPRLEQTYESTIKPDLMTLSYHHHPPGYEAPEKSQRLREWIGDSPYFKNRPLRGPRGGDTLRLLRKPITFKNVPKLEGITVHSMVPKAADDSAHLHVASMVVQAITNVRVTTHKARQSVSQWGLREGRYVAVKAELAGEDMYDFLAKTIDLILPRIKEWKGAKGSSGDSSGNIAFGLPPDAVAMYPEIEVNYDMYPPKMIPGCHIIVKTTADTDRDARLLVNSLGIPFYGKLRN
ncbi:mitochondrial 54s ribosomal protein 7 5 [Botryosphaeria dothidea]|uniref:Large ribosomal subunit protein uL5m n=1 Tax=Botryosphaeria dothidea TaxID=55169 RepID=A0A8H4N1W2_9PEZI|nr:mitochondrial 54s ribosomal protein 7 5 [Botryosphaeria dothidea]